MRYLILIALFFSSSAFSKESNWFYIGTNTSSADYYLDTNNVRYKRDSLEGNLILIWVKSDHKNDKSVPWREGKSFFEINCEDYTYKIVQTITYRADKTIYDSAQGTILDSFLSAAPETISYAIVDTTCRLGL